MNVERKLRFNRLGNGFGLWTALVELREVRERREREAREVRAAEFELSLAATDWIRAEDCDVPVPEVAIPRSIPSGDPIAVVRAGLLGRGYLSAAAREPSRPLEAFEVERITRGVASLYSFAAARPGERLWPAEWGLWHRVVRSGRSGLYALEMVEGAIRLEIEELRWSETGST